MSLQQDHKSHREMCQRTVAWLLLSKGFDYALTEADIPGLSRQPDAAGFKCSLRGPDEDAAEMWLVECKRRRPDLTSDLEAGKMQTYGDAASHCVLVLQQGAMPKMEYRHHGRHSSFPIILADLRRLGLPDHWGVHVSFDNHLGRPGPLMVARHATAIRSLTNATVAPIAERSMRALCARASSGLLSRELLDMSGESMTPTLNQSNQ